jgi:hypothetical protein
VPTADGADLLPELPPAWQTANVAAYHVPVPLGVVSFAVRWHGARPAVLWEAFPDLRLRTPGLDPGWSTTEATGEALLNPP